MAFSCKSHHNWMPPPSASRISAAELAGALFSSMTFSKRGISSFHILGAVPLQTCQLLCDERFFLCVLLVLVKMYLSVPVITGQVHQFYPESVLPGAPVPHLQPSLHTCLHFASHVPPPWLRGQPDSPSSPLAAVDLASSALHSSPVLQQLLHGHASTTKQSPAFSQPCSPFTHRVTPTSTYTTSSTPQPWDPLMIKRGLLQMKPKRKSDNDFVHMMCLNLWLEVQFLFGY